MAFGMEKAAGQTQNGVASSSGASARSASLGARLLVLANEHAVVITLKETSRPLEDRHLVFRERRDHGHVRCVEGHQLVQHTKVLAHDPTRTEAAPPLPF